MELPHVNFDIGHSLAREVVCRDDKEYLEEQLNRLEKENPAVSRWIRNFSKTTRDRLGSMFCAVMVYRLLESQAEADRMTREIKV